MYTSQFQDVFRFLLSLTKDASLAEELTQETFFRAMKGLGGFQNKSKVSTWLCQIAKNTYYSHCRKNRRIPYEEYEQVNMEDGLTSLLHQENIHALHRALHYLPEPYKEVFALRVFAELSYNQIAVLFEKSENWARVTFYRAKARLKQRVEDNSDE